jgi:CubicO group peptidase (beta-lactamase class C family)
MNLLTLVFLVPALAPQDTPPALADVTAPLEREIERLIAETGVPSISIALVRAAEVVWTAAFGYANVAARVPATPDTGDSADSTEKMHRPQFDARPYGLGIGLARAGSHDVIHRSGGVPGFRSFLVAEPATRQGVYVMSNAQSDAPGALARYAMQLMWGEAR